MQTKALAIGFLLLILTAGCTCAPPATPEPTAPPPTDVPPPPTATPVPTEEETGAWEIIHQMDVQPQTFTAGFYNDLVGLNLTSGHDSEIYSTADGGETWTEATDAPLTPYGIDIVDENLAWSIGDIGQVRVSKDGGENWQEVSNLGYSGNCLFISFLDDQTGWAGSLTSHQLWSTNDGGQTWVEIAPPEGAEDFAAIMLRTANDGYLLDNAGTLFITQDGGQSWSFKSLGLDVGILTATNTPLAAMRFLDADHGLIVMMLAGGGGEVIAMRTADGGETWTQESVWPEYSSPYLSRDGTFLTLTSTLAKITVLRYQ